MPWIEHQGPALGEQDHTRLVAYVGRAADGRYDNPHHGRSEPQAYRVDTPAGGAPLRTHFHTVDQFQFVGWGGGRIGAHDVGPGSVHYADAFTPYGPLRPGGRGLSYLTLRPTTDTGISYMPDSRDQLREALASGSGGGSAARSRRSFTLDLRAARVDPDHGAPWIRLVDDPDGLVVAVAECPAGGVLDVPEARGPGAYLVVVDGTIHDGHAIRGPGAVRWCAPRSRVSVGSGPGADHTPARVALLSFGERGR